MIKSGIYDAEQRRQAAPCDPRFYHGTGHRSLRNQTLIEIQCCCAHLSRDAPMSCLPQTMNEERPTSSSLCANVKRIKYLKERCYRPTCLSKPRKEVRSCNSHPTQCWNKHLQAIPTLLHPMSGITLTAAFNSTLGAIFVSTEVSFL